MAKTIISLGLLSLLAISPSFVLAAVREECYNDNGKLRVIGSSTYLSSGLCQRKCLEQHFNVYAVKSDKCFCGHKLPPINAKVSTEECNIPCPGYRAQNCGGNDTWTVFSDNNSTPHEPPKSESASASPTVRTLNVNPNVIQTGIASQTSIPSNILTAPTIGSKDAEVAQAIAVPSSSASSSSPTSNAGVSASPTSFAFVVGAVSLLLVVSSWFG